jgi:molybdopterin converting factor small subunit
MFGAARAHFGQSALSLEASNLTDLLAALAQGDAKGERVLQQCSFLRNATALHDQSEPFSPGDEIDVLPPFAGG